MQNFFLEITGSGIIIDIKWSSPTHLVTSLNIHFNEIFSKKSGETLEILLSELLTDADGFLTAEWIELNEENKSFNLCFLKDENKFYVFGVESSDFIQGETALAFKEIVHNFMLTVKEYIASNPFGSNTSTRFQFENIQSLNNQLINTKRMLEKANARLKILNDDLNNRLVKDALTGLLSRYQYRTEIESLIALSPEDKGIFVFIDIDDFKSINDTYGHGVGDLYLVEFARRLDSIPLEDKLTMRVAGDEFGIYVHGISSDVAKGDDIGNNDSKGSFVEFAQKIWDYIFAFVISEPFIAKGITMKFKVSAGMAVFGKDTTHIYDLIDYADFAMYCAKKSGKNNYNLFNKDYYLEQKGEKIK